MPASLCLQALQARSRFLEQILQETFSQCDLLLLPVLKQPVPTAAETDVSGGTAMPEVIGRIAGATRPLNYLGLPGLVVPIGRTRNGLPQAMQLIARPFREDLLFRVGAAYEAGSGHRLESPAL